DLPVTKPELIWNRIVRPHSSIEATQCGTVCVVTENNAFVIWIGGTSKISVAYRIFKPLYQCLPPLCEWIVTRRLSLFINTHIYQCDVTGCCQLIEKVTNYCKSV